MSTVMLTSSGDLPVDAAVRMSIRTVLFDLDGTLVDSAPDLAGATNEMLAARGLPEVPFERLRPMVGTGARGMMGVAFGVSPMEMSFPALRDEFFAKACKKDPVQVQAMWGKLIFTGTGTPPAEVDSSAAMKKTVAADPNAVGYIDKKDADASVKVIATAN